MFYHWFWITELYFKILFFPCSYDFHAFLKGWHLRFLFLLSDSSILSFILITQQMLSPLSSSLIWSFPFHRCLLLKFQMAEICWDGEILVIKRKMCWRNTIAKTDIRFCVKMQVHWELLRWIPCRVELNNRIKHAWLDYQFASLCIKLNST